MHIEIQLQGKSMQKHDQNIQSRQVSGHFKENSIQFEDLSKTPTQATWRNIDWSSNTFRQIELNLTNLKSSTYQSIGSSRNILEDHLDYQEKFEKRVHFRFMTKQERRKQTSYIIPYKIIQETISSSHIEIQDNFKANQDANSHLKTITFIENYPYHLLGLDLAGSYNNRICKQIKQTDLDLQQVSQGGFSQKNINAKRKFSSNPPCPTYENTIICQFGNSTSKRFKQTEYKNEYEEKEFINSVQQIEDINESQYRIQIYDEIQQQTYEGMPQSMNKTKQSHYCERKSGQLTLSYNRRSIGSDYHSLSEKECVDEYIKEETYFKKQNTFYLHNMIPYYNISDALLERIQIKFILYLQSDYKYLKDIDMQRYGLIKNSDIFRLIFKGTNIQLPQNPNNDVLGTHNLLECHNQTNQNIDYNNSDNLRSKKTSNSHESSSLKKKEESYSQSLHQINKQPEQDKSEGSIDKKQYNYNMSKYFMQFLISLFEDLHLQLLGVDSHVKALLLSLFGKVETISRKNKHSKTVYYTHRHYDLLFLHLNHSNLNDKILQQMHHKLFNLSSTSNHDDSTQDFLINSINITKQHIVKIVLSQLHALNHFLQNLVFTNANESYSLIQIKEFQSKINYFQRVNQSILSLSRGNHIQRF